MRERFAVYELYLYGGVSKVLDWMAGQCHVVPPSGSILRMKSQQNDGGWPFNGQLPQLVKNGSGLFLLLKCILVLKFDSRSKSHCHHNGFLANFCKHANAANESM